MATSRLSEVVQHLRKVVLLRDGGGLSDGQLLESFVAHRDEDAFAALVRRHAPMVWGVCRRILHSHHQAEDAFQATFLVLVRKAASVVPREMVANWLYGVAYQTAFKARAMAAKRGARERQVMHMPEPKVAEHHLWNDMQHLLDQELSRLPEKYRMPVVLCELEGKTRKEAAKQMGVPEGTVASRLARGRTMLAHRLARQGIAVTAASLTATLTQNAIAAAPSTLVSSTIKAASLLAAGQVATGAISAKAVFLTEGVIKAMLLSKLKIATAALLTAAIVGAVVGTSGVFNQLSANGISTDGVANAPDTQQTKGPDVRWSQIDEEARALAILHLQQTPQNAHAEFQGKHGAWPGLQDCKSCHNMIQGDANISPKRFPKNESDSEKIKRLEQELAKERSDRELLQMEIWILLQEIQRQKQQTSK
ncbi:MAG TPA: RNA polymerase sigma factor [Gemmataceae bacterium]|nr:RNA polymerase sigma factor [Gemmataceae bacterium]